MGEVCPFLIVDNICCKRAILLDADRGIRRKGTPMNQYRRRASNVLSKPHARKAAPKRRKRIANHAVIRWLVCCLPVGLALMWHPGCKWKKMNKATITLACAALVTMLAVGVAGMLQEGQKNTGGVYLVSSKPMVEAYGPVIPEGVTYTYADANTIEQAVVITPEPTIEPETAYCNAGGRYFHTENCRFVKEHTPCYYVPYLLGQGFDPCEECEARVLAAEYTGGY